MTSFACAHTLGDTKAIRVAQAEIGDEPTDRMPPVDLDSELNSDAIVPGGS